MLNVGRCGYIRSTKYFKIDGMKYGESKMFNIKILQALKGDCIIVSYGMEEIHHILIDGGQGRPCFRQLCKYVDDIKQAGEKIDLLILTHIDSDHIDGILRLLSNECFDFSMIKEMWFDFGEGLQNLFGIRSKEQKINLYNKGTEISWKQGMDVEAKVKESGIKTRVVEKLERISVGGADITILSPSKEVLRKFAEQNEEKEKSITQIAYSNDYHRGVFELNQKEPEKEVSLTNKSSIACLFEFNGQGILLLGDADADEVADALTGLGYSKDNKLKVNYCKIAHHASKHNTTNELIQMLDCSNYIISTQQTTQGRPSKECLSRIVCNSEKPITFYCNYELNYNKIFTKEEFLKYKMKFVVLEETGIDVGEK